ncbi:MAG: YdcF family protein [Euzebya sp.]
MRAWLVVRVVMVISLIGFGAGTVVVFGGDSDPVPQHADAIVALGGTDQRERTALALFERGVADRLVISAPRVDDGADDRTVTARRICADPPTGVVCFVPDPSTTRGEVQFVRRMTEDEGGTPSRL